jgi:hypothetical protein
MWFGMTGLLLALCGALLPAQESGFGAGLVAGEPLGVNAKLWISQTIALDAAAAWSFYRKTGSGERMAGAYYVHAGYLRHFYDVVKADSGTFVFFVGFGGKITFREEFYFGVRLPIGLTYMIENQPLDIFIELAPAVVLIPGTTSDMGAIVGIRYWFK